MKTYFDNMPPSVQYAESSDGTVVYFRENIEEVESAFQMLYGRYVADEYSVAIRCSTDIAKKRVEENYDSWLRHAKNNERHMEPSVDRATILMELAADHEERLCLLELGV